MSFLILRSETMKKIMIIIIYITLISIPCYSGVNQRYYDTVKVCNDSYDETWDKLMELLVKFDADVELTNKESGLISAKIVFNDDSDKSDIVIDMKNFSHIKNLTGKFYFLVSKVNGLLKVKILSEFIAVKEIKGIGKASGQTLNISCKSSGKFEKEIFNNLD